MASRSTDQRRKQELITTLARSRQSIGLGRAQLKHQLNPAVRLRRTVRNKPLAVFGIAAGGAFVLTLLLRRPRRKRGDGKKPTPAKRLLLRWALSLAKPAARVWLLNRAKEHFLPGRQEPLLGPGGAIPSAIERSE